MISLLHLYALIVVVPLLSMEGQRALGFHQKYLNLCFEHEQRSYGFGTTWGWVLNERIFIFGWTIYLNSRYNQCLHCEITVISYFIQYIHLHSTRVRNSVSECTYWTKLWLQLDNLSRSKLNAKIDTFHFISIRNSCNRFSLVVQGHFCRIWLLFCMQIFLVQYHYKFKGAQRRPSLLMGAPPPPPTLAPNI